MIYSLSSQALGSERYIDPDDNGLLLVFYGGEVPMTYH